MFLFLFAWSLLMWTDMNRCPHSRLNHRSTKLRDWRAQHSRFSFHLQTRIVTLLHTQWSQTGGSRQCFALLRHWFPKWQDQCQEESNSENAKCRVLPDTWPCVCYPQAKKHLFWCWVLFRGYELEFLLLIFARGIVLSNTGTEPLFVPKQTKQGERILSLAPH